MLGVQSLKTFYGGCSIFWWRFFIRCTSLRETYIYDRTDWPTDMCNAIQGVIEISIFQSSGLLNLTKSLRSSHYWPRPAPWGILFVKQWQCTTRNRLNDGMAGLHSGNKVWVTVSLRTNFNAMVDRKSGYCKRDGFITDRHLQTDGQTRRSIFVLQISPADLSGQMT